MTSPWLDSSPPPDVRRLTDRQLVETWRQNRNGMLGLMAADEGMRRLVRREAEGRACGREPARPAAQAAHGSRA